MRRWMKVGLTIGALALCGRSAEAQARGSLQASATVVDTRQGFEALTAVRQVVTNSRIESRESVATVALVTTEQPVTRPTTLVITVDFARN
jgi:hypothetical protein